MRLGIIHFFLLLILYSGVNALNDIIKPAQETAQDEAIFLNNEADSASANSTHEPASGVKSDQARGVSPNKADGKDLLNPFKKFSFQSIFKRTSSPKSDDIKSDSNIIKKSGDMKPNSTIIPKSDDVESDLVGEKEFSDVSPDLVYPEMIFNDSSTDSSVHASSPDVHDKQDSIDIPDSFHLDDNLPVRARLSPDESRSEISSSSSHDIIEDISPFSDKIFSGKILEPGQKQKNDDFISSEEGIPDTIIPRRHRPKIHDLSQSEKIWNKFFGPKKAQTPRNEEHTVSHVRDDEKDVVGKKSARVTRRAKKKREELLAIPNPSYEDEVDSIFADEVPTHQHMRRKRSARPAITPEQMSDVDEDGVHDETDDMHPYMIYGHLPKIETEETGRQIKKYIEDLNDAQELAEMLAKRVSLITFISVATICGILFLIVVGCVSTRCMGNNEGPSSGRHFKHSVS